MVVHSVTKYIGTWQRSCTHALIAQPRQSNSRGQPPHLHTHTRTILRLHSRTYWPLLAGGSCLTAIGGHSDVVGGVVVTNRDDINEKLR